MNTLSPRGGLGVSLCVVAWSAELSQTLVSKQLSGFRSVPHGTYPFSKHPLFNPPIVGRSSHASPIPIPPSPLRMKNPTPHF